MFFKLSDFHPAMAPAMASAAGTKTLPQENDQNLT
jgi:hypothetical protein